MKTQHQQQTIFRFLLFSSLILLGGILVLVSFLSYRYNYQSALEERVFQKLNQSGDILSNKVADHFEEIQQSAKVIANDYLIREALLKNRSFSAEDWSSIMIAYQEALGYAQVSVYDAETKWRHTDEDFLGEEINDLRKTPKWLNAFLSSQNEGMFRVLTSYQDKNELIIRYDLKITHNGKLLGVVGINAPWHGIKEYLYQFRPMEEGEVMLLTSKGKKRIANPDSPFKTELISQQEGLAEVADELLEVKNGLYSFKSNHIAYHAGVKEVLNTGWIILNVMNEKHMMASVYRSTFLMVAFVLAALLLVVLFYVFIFRQVTANIPLIGQAFEALAVGDVSFTNDRNHRFQEFSTLWKSYEDLRKSMVDITGFTKGIEEGDFHQEFAVRGEADDLGASLIQMANQLRTLDAEQQERLWINQGVNEVSAFLLQNQSDILGKLPELLSKICRYIGANQSCIYLKEGEEHPIMQLHATYAYGRLKHISNKILPGEGLIGQVWLENEITELTDVPAQYVNITSGLGEATPGHIIILPMEFNEQVVGIIEFASFQQMPEKVKTMMDRVCTQMASTLFMYQNARYTEDLLKASQEQEEQLRAQEEELRQNMEEMMATQEQLRRQAEDAESMA